MVEDAVEECLLYEDGFVIIDGHGAFDECAWCWLAFGDLMECPVVVFESWCEHGGFLLLRMGLNGIENCGLSQGGFDCLAQGCSRVETVGGIGALLRRGRRVVASGAGAKKEKPPSVGFAATSPGGPVEERRWWFLCDFVLVFGR